MHRGKLIAIYKAIQAKQSTHTSMEAKVQWPKIFVSHETQTLNDSKVSLAGPSQPIQSCSDLLQRASSSCRLTLRGENGCGKSTSLMLVKKALKHRAFFLPTHNTLSFVSETNRHSTGESLKKRLNEILENVEVDVLLLDEWDANLDRENQESLSKLIDELSSKKCVIEVRHR